MAIPTKAVITSVGGAIGGGTSNSTQPVITGTAAAGTYVNIYDGVRMIGTATVAANGTWSFTPPAALKGGTHSFTAIDVGSDGTFGTTSASMSVVISTSAPVVPATPVINGMTDDNGHALSSPTNDAHPWINGTGTPGDTITLYDNGTAVGSATIGADGKWKVRPTTDLSNGTHDLYVIDTSPAGTPSLPSTPTHVVIDTSVPATPAAPTMTDDNGLPITPGSTTTDAHPHINGKGVAGDLITVYDGQTVIGSTKVDGNGNWSFTPSPDLSNGTHSINVTETNAAGTPSAHSSPISVVIDTSVPVPVAPVITNLIDAVGSITGAITNGMTTDDSRPTLNGKGTAGDVIILMDMMTVIGSTVVQANGTWSVQPNTALADGLHNLYATEKNAAGTSPNSTIIQFKVDTSTPATPAVPTLTDDNYASIPPGGTTNDGHPHISGKGVAGDLIKVYDGSKVIGSVTVDGNGNWTFTPSSDLSAGSHSISVTETNVAGTTSSRSGTIYFTFSAVAPAPVITSVADVVGSTPGNVPNGGTSHDPNPKLSGTGIAGDTIYVYQNGVGCGDTVVAANGTWSVTLNTGLGSGSHAFTATQFASGQPESAKSNTWTVTTVPTSTVPTETVTITNLVDHTVVNGNVAAGGSTYDTAPTVQGKLSSVLQSGEQLAVYRDGQKVGVATVSGTGWSFSDSGVALGSHTYTARVESTSGQGQYSNPFGFSEVAPIFDLSKIQVSTDSVSSANQVFFTFNQPDGYMLSANVGGVSQRLYYTLRMYDSNGNCLSTPITAAPMVGTSFPYPYQSLSMWAVGPGLTSAQWNWNAVLVWSVQVGAASGPEYLLDAHRATDFAFGPTYSTYTSYGYMTRLPTSLGDLPASLAGGLKSTLLGATHAADDVPATANSDADTDPSTSHHTVVGEHDAFKGTTGHDTVDLNADPTSYFKETTAHIEGSTVHPVDASGAAPAVNTLHLTGDHQILDLTSLTGKTAAAKISGIEVIDLGGQHNTLKLSLTDVLNLGETDLFQQDGKQQMMVQGKEGDAVDLSNSHIAGLAEGEWQQHGTAQVGGVTYNVYEHSGAHTELLVQQGVQIVVH